MVKSVLNGVVRLDRCDEVARNESSALMDQLVERVLTVGSWLTPHNRTRLVVYSSAIPKERIRRLHERNGSEIEDRTL